MSAGPFQTGVYQADGGDFHRIRVQPETLALVIDSNTNDEASGTINSDFAAQSSRSRRSYGLHARVVRIKFTGDVPEGYKPESPIQLPWLVPGTYASLRAGQTGSYLGQAIELIGKTPEVAR